MKRVRGYIFSRSFMGERVPQHVQNLVIRDYCQRNNLEYLLSATEYAMSECHLIHQQVMNELESIDGVVAYSLYQLPMIDSQRHAIYDRIINLEKSYYFAVEGLSIKNTEDCNRIDSIWKIKMTLPDCYYSDVHKTIENRG